MIVESGDGAAGILMQGRGGEAIGEVRAVGRPQMVDQHIDGGALRALDVVAMEEAAKVHTLVFDAGESDVGAITEVEFEIRLKGEVRKVHFEPQPRGGGLGAATGGD